MSQSGGHDFWRLMRRRLNCRLIRGDRSQTRKQKWVMTESPPIRDLPWVLGIVLPRWSRERKPRHGGRSTRLGMSHGSSHSVSVSHREVGREATNLDVGMIRFNHSDHSRTRHTNRGWGRCGGQWYARTIHRCCQLWWSADSFKMRRGHVNAWYRDACQCSPRSVDRDRAHEHGESRTLQSSRGCALVIGR